MKRSDSSRLCKELAGLSPWGWDSRKDLHPPGPASKRDFSEVDKLALHHQIDSTQGCNSGAAGATATPKPKAGAQTPGKRERRDVPRLPVKVDDLFEGFAGAGKKRERLATDSPSIGSARKRERSAPAVKKITIKLSSTEAPRTEVSRAKKPTTAPGKKAEAKAVQLPRASGGQGKKSKDRVGTPAKASAKVAATPKKRSPQWEKSPSADKAAKRTEAAAVADKPKVSQKDKDLKAKKKRKDKARTPKKAGGEESAAAKGKAIVAKVQPPKKWGVRKFKTKPKNQAKPLSAMLIKACQVISALDKKQGWFY